MEVKIGKYIICKNAEYTLEIYKITGVTMDRGIVRSEPMIDVELVKEVELKKRRPTVIGLDTKLYGESWAGMSNNLGYGRYSPKELTDNFRELTHAEQVLYGI